MATSSDMSTPVTRGELREELGHLEQRFDGKLERWGGALLARIQAGEQRLLERIEAGERLLARIEARIEAGEQRLLADLARHVGAIQDAVSSQISVIDEKYADLPSRVSRLEAAEARRRPRSR